MGNRTWDALGTEPGDALRVRGEPAWAGPAWRISGDSWPTRHRHGCPPGGWKLKVVLEMRPSCQPGSRVGVHSMFKALKRSTMTLASSRKPVRHTPCCNAVAVSATGGVLGTIVGGVVDKGVLGITDAGGGRGCRLVPTRVALARVAGASTAAFGAKACRSAGTGRDGLGAATRGCCGTGLVGLGTGCASTSSSGGPCAMLTCWKM